MYRFLAVSLAISSVISQPAQGAGGHFLPEGGYPIYKPGTVKCREGMTADAICYELAEDFSYINTYAGRERGFQAKAGLITDGASIPKWAQRFIGKPHEKAFSRAAVIHDHYVLKENAVLDYFLTQRVFRDILIDSGVDKARANAMFLAVLAFAPKWSIFYSAEPEACVDLPSEIYCVRSEPGEPDDVINYVDGVAISDESAKVLESYIDVVDMGTASDVVIESLAIRIRMELGLQTPAPFAFGDGG